MRSARCDTGSTPPPNRSLIAHALAAKRRSIVALCVMHVGVRQQTHERQVQQRRAQHAPIAIAAPSQSPHGARRSGAIVFRPAIERVGLVDVDPSRKQAHLTRQRDRAPAVESRTSSTNGSSSHQATFCGMRVIAATGDRDQAAPTKQ